MDANGWQMDPIKDVLNGQSYPINIHCTSPRHVGGTRINTWANIPKGAYPHYLTLFGYFHN